MKQLLDVLRAGDGVRALAHITGGGLPENLPRVLPDHLAAVVDLDAVPVPPVFRWLARIGDVPHDDVLRTFNCGIGMVVVAASDKAEEVEAALAASGPTPIRLGTLEPRAEAPIGFRGKLAL